jgi:ribosomal-protein-alanine N-acetyltransferase
LPEAQHWPASAYLAALNPEGTLRRVALVATAVKEDGLYGLKPAPFPVPASFTQLVGFAVASLVAQEAELEMIAVAGAVQRQGVAGRLFAAMRERLRSVDVTELALEVRNSNRPALGFYRSLGFREIGLRQRYYADPVEDAVLMSLQIGSVAAGRNSMGGS